MINLFIALLLFATSCLAAFAGSHAYNITTRLLLNLASFFYLFASIWKLIVFGVWLVKYLF